MTIEAHPNGSVLTVRVVPRSSRNQIDGIVDGALRVRLTAPPVDGAANAALIELFSREFGVPKSRVEIVSGARGRRKRVLLRDVAPPAVRRALELD